MWPRPIFNGALLGPPEKDAPNAHYPQSVSSHWEGKPSYQSPPAPNFDAPRWPRMGPIHRCLCR